MSGGGDRSGKVSGAWVLKSTRMPVSAIFENLDARASLDDIKECMTASIASRSKQSSSLPSLSKGDHPKHGS